MTSRDQADFALSGVLPTGKEIEVLDASEHPISAKALPIVKHGLQLVQLSLNLGHFGGTGPEFEALEKRQCYWWVEIRPNRKRNWRWI